jgi:hypothetical protein
MSPTRLSAVSRSVPRAASRWVAALGVAGAGLALAGSAAAHPYVGVNPPVSAAASSSIIDFSASTHTGSSRVRSVHFFVDGRRVHVDRVPRWRVPGGIDTRRLSNGLHRLRARAVFANGSTKVAARTITVRNPAPAAPTGLTAVAGSDSITLDWDDNSERDFSYYAVRRSLSADGPWERLPGKHTSSRYVDTSAQAGRRYYYFVTAMDEAVNVSKPSPVVDAMIEGPANEPSEPSDSTPSPSDPNPNPPIWSAGFEGGLLASWLDVHAMSDRAEAESGDAREGTRAARFEVRPGDSFAGTARAQVYGAKKADGSELRFREGDDYFIGFSMKLDPAYPLDESKWQQLVSFMRDGSGQGPLKLGTSFERDSFRLEGPDGDKVYWRGPVEKGGWLDFVFRIRFSTDPSKGFIEAWYKRPGDGELVRQSMANGQERLYVNTMAAGSSFSYLKAGVYRDTSFSTTSRVWYDAFRIGHRLEDVAPR